MGFMEQQITGKMGWIEISTLNGTWFVQAMDISQDVLDYCAERSADICEIPENIKAEIIQFTECFDLEDIDGIEYVEGYGTRLSAPGYMDCTEWCVFDTVEEAEAYIKETYGDD